MGYRAKKIEAEKKWKLFRRIALCIFIALFLGVCIFSAFVPMTEWKYRVAKPDVSKRAEGELRIHFVSVGQGDATIVELPDGKVMLIDGGPSEEESEKNLLRYLNALKIDEIDYLVVTHTDADHCGGLKKVVEQKTVLNAYLPAAYDEDDEEYAAFYAALSKTDCKSSTASRRVDLSSGGNAPYTLAFVYPYATDEETEEDTANDESSVVWLDYYGSSALFTGDSSSKIEEVLLRDDQLFDVLSESAVVLSSTEILKVAHHGSEYSSSAEFLQYLGVKTAVVSCGKGNRYGHPSEEVLSRLSSVGATTYRTDEDGHVMLTLSVDGSYKAEKIAIG